jgi:hypothetical protein
MAKVEPAPDIAEVVKATRAEVAAGERLVQKASEDFGLDPHDDEDGPLTRAWKRRDLTVKATPSMINEMLINLIEFIVASERKGRRVAAGAGLVRLREHYDNVDPRDLRPDEQSWLAFATKHLPLPPERVAELIGKTVLHGGVLRCTKCGTFTRCACGCGRPYVSGHRWGMGVEAIEPAKVAPAPQPSALDRAAAAIAAHPEKSNRVIAAEIDVAEPTVRRARQRIRDAGGDDAVDDAVDGRVGRDGRRRKLPGRTAAFQMPDPDRDLLQDTHPDAITEEQRWQWSAANAAGDAIAMRAFWAREFGDWQRFKPPSELLTLAQDAVAAWQSLASDLEDAIET